MKQDNQTKNYTDRPFRSRFKKKEDWLRAMAEWERKQELEEGKYRLLKMRHQSQAFRDQTRALSKSQKTMQEK